ncbi:MAG: exodeoxyribonuclease VII large subunit [Deltaproteobacteria bacterium CG11_big_fil_rev_8_21_14_0_20_45_16]|nr:MAG: exodeoxyribonuclease VII large subunit [Deltaproteobacteria bacterium CG11_big_fil_rev_8_21_14_0_20_45_16]
MSYEFEYESTEQGLEGASKLGTREKPLSVSELTHAIKSQLESQFAQVVMVGEVSNFKAHPSGHHYFSLKDEAASISAVMFRGANSRLKFQLENGQRVVAIGKISVYPPRGSYQIVLSQLEPEGLGALQLAFEQLKKKLESEGLFAAERKRGIPKFPTCVALITSSSGAAVRDMLNVLDRRFSGLHVLIYPVKVQGDGSAQEIARGIADINNFFPEVDVMIVGRGGGSIEDLWAFNEEVVARALAASRIPTISAVGHEVDFTIADFVADLRAPTPSAAAELVIANKIETIRHVDHLVQRLARIEGRLEYFRMKLDDLSQRLSGTLMDTLSDRRLNFEKLKMRLFERSPFMLLKETRYRFDLAIRDLNRLPIERIRNLKQQVEHYIIQLKLLNPRGIMERGYSIVRLAKSGRIVTKVSDVKMGDQLLIELNKGKITAKV